MQEHRNAYTTTGAYYRVNNVAACSKTITCI